jgi:NAD(P)-dependent dehydrogenase (short-subunit alcohol dehydrogenase family)
MSETVPDRVIAPDVSDRSLGQLYDLAGRVAVVTGGSRGIGLATAARLAEAGAHVVLADVVIERAEEAAAALAARGLNALALAVDVRSSESVDALFAGAAQRLGGVDILVNNAGLLPPTPHVEEMDDELWARVYEVNVNGVMRCARAAIPQLVRSRFGGCIVNLSSTSAFRISNPGISPYASSKHAVDGINKALALELGPRGVRVNAVAPTVVESPGLAELRAATAGRKAPLGNANAFAAMLPLGRIAVEDDVARAILFLASDMAKLITGTTLAVDAGSMVR